MPIKEQVILEFIVDDDQLGQSIDSLATLAGADQKLVDKLKQSAAAFAERKKSLEQSNQSQQKFIETNTQGVQSVEQLSAAMRSSLGNIAKGGLKSLSFEIRRGIVDELQKAGVTVKQFKAAYAQTFDSNTKNTRSLSQELRIARNELAVLSATPGVDPLKLREAGERAGFLANQLKNVNQTINAFNPDVKFQSLNTLGSGLFGTLNSAQVAMRAFGQESEEVNTLLQKFSGLLGFSFGIAQLIQLKDAWKNVQLSLGGATEAKTEFVDGFKDVAEVSKDTKAIVDVTKLSKEGIDALSAAKLKDAAASNTAATANKALALSMPTVAIGALVIGMAALIGYLITLEKETDETSEALDRLFKKRSQGRELENEIRDITLQLQIARGEVSELDGALIANARNSAKELAPLLAEREKLNEKIKEQEKLLLGANKALETAAQLEKEGLAGAAATARAQNAERKKVVEENIKAFKKESVQLDANIDLILKKIKAESDLIRQQQKLKDAAKKPKEKEEELEREPIVTENAEKRFGNEKRAIELATTSLNLTERQSTALRILGFEGIKSSEIFLTLNSTQKEALNALNDYAKGSYETLASYFEKAKNEIKNSADVIGTTITQTGTDLNNEMFKKQDELNALILEILDGTEQIFNNVAAIGGINLAGALQKEVSFFEAKKQAELKNKRLTDDQKIAIEEKYNAKINKAREEAAKKQRQADIISLAVNQSLAIGKLATTTPPSGPTAPAFFIGLGVILSTFAAQLAAIRAAPLPQFKDGVERVQGPGTKRSDSILAKLSRGERVVDADTNEEYYPALSGIHNRKVPASAINSFVEEYNRNVPVKKVNHFIEEFKRNTTVTNEKHFIEEYDRNFTVTKNITRNVTGAQENNNDESIIKRLAMQLQLGVINQNQPSEYDKQSTDYLRIIAESISRDGRSENLRRSRS